METHSRSRPHPASTSGYLHHRSLSLSSSNTTTTSTTLVPPIHHSRRTPHKQSPFPLALDSQSRSPLSVHSSITCLTESELYSRVLPSSLSSPPAPTDIPYKPILIPQNRIPSPQESRDTFTYYYYYKHLSTSYFLIVRLFALFSLLPFSPPPLILLVGSSGVSVFG